VAGFDEHNWPKSMKICRLWIDQPGDFGGSVPTTLDKLLLDGAQGEVRLEGHGSCLMPDREAGVPV
jgi:hypothetical protein